MGWKLNDLIMQTGKGQISKLVGLGLLRNQHCFINFKYISHWMNDDLNNDALVKNVSPWYLEIDKPKLCF